MRSVGSVVLTLTLAATTLLFLTVSVVNYQPSKDMILGQTHTQLTSAAELIASQRDGRRSRWPGWKPRQALPH